MTPIHTPAHLTRKRINVQDMIPSIAMLAAIALVVGAVVLLRAGNSRAQAFLMLVMAVVLVGNVLIWLIPTHR